MLHSYKELRLDRTTVPKLEICICEICYSTSYFSVSEGVVFKQGTHG